MGSVKYSHFNRSYSSYSEISQNLVHHNKNLMISETSLISFEPVCGKTLELTDTCDIFPVTKLTWPRHIGFFPFFPNFT